MGHNLMLLIFTFFHKVTGKCSDCAMSFGIDDSTGEGSQTLDAKALIGYNFSTSFVPDTSTCLEVCADNCKCTSMNYKKSEENNGFHACELNYETNSSKPEALLPTNGYYYIDVSTYKAPRGQCKSSACNNGCCAKSPCKNNGKCQELCEGIHRFNCTCSRLFEGRLCENHKCDRNLSLVKDGQKYTFCTSNEAAKNCKEWFDDNFNVSAVYPIDPDGQGEFNVWCDMEDGGYTVMQRNRYNAAENLRRTWEEYKTGFGDLSAVFWLGNEKIYRITNAQKTALKVVVTYQNRTGFAKYENFTLENEENGYRLHVSEYNGDAGDSFSYASREPWRSNGHKFSTPDRDNDKNPSHDCGKWGGWWFNDCSASSLNQAQPQWYTFTGVGERLAKTVMKIIPA